MRNLRAIRAVTLSAAKRSLLTAVLIFMSLAAADGWSGAAASQPRFTTDASVPAPFAPEGVPWTPPAPAYRIYVEADGMYRLDYAYLGSQNLPVDSINPQTFRVFSMGTEIAIQVTGDGDTQFESGEAVVFYGRSLRFAVL